MALSRTERNAPHPHTAAGCKHFSPLSVNGSRSYLFMKRLLDIFGALAGLVLLSPVFLVIALFIKKEDPGHPVIFKQVRLGKNGKPFYIYKFRSMIPNAEALLDNLRDQNNVTGAMFKIKDDPRITRIGHFIRKSSLDELPQLVNVLKGEMTLVGPRPPLPGEVADYSDYDRQRLLVTPGCTGLWQVSGRSDLSFDQMVELDLSYIANRSLLLDAKIMIKTVFVMFGSDGAY
ncbi:MULTISPECIES: sugar transferase [unclassified Sporolactobacillus]|uniref:sugar transferase n=1 Tax=unclassified Sporolactobacillus TaxID=2628533 RepID=UPI002368B019|nr:sugar transferase [Sporolactobacillus sp. CQH2019]MDD9148207.1 sugar transferase [Sporolactobacillus sp. CQH2019]